MRPAFLVLLAFACSSHQVGNVMGACVSTGAGVATATAAPSKKPAVRVLDNPPVPDGALPGPAQP